MTDSEDPDLIDELTWMDPEYDGIMGGRVQSLPGVGA